MKNPFSHKKRQKKAGKQNAEKPKAASITADMALDKAKVIEPMTNARLEALIREASKTVEGQLGYWHFKIEGRDLLVITDEAHNRMRIMSPVASQDGLTIEEMTRLLEANFASALDAKYALRDGTLWSVFTHPLAELSDMQFLDCLAQVSNLARNYGSSYASSNLTFGGG